MTYKLAYLKTTASVRTRKIKNEEEYSQFRFTPILMLTTEAGKDKKEEGKKLGAKAWIVKPFKPDQLIKSVQTLIS